MDASSLAIRENHLKILQALLKGTKTATKTGTKRVAKTSARTTRKAESAPKLPPKIIAEKDGVKITHYTRSGDHAPAHLHVKGGGVEVRIGQNGKPLRGGAELSPKQARVVRENLSTIRRSVRKIQSWHRFHYGE